MWIISAYTLHKAGYPQNSMELWKNMLTNVETDLGQGFARWFHECIIMLMLFAVNSKMYDVIITTLTAASTFAEIGHGAGKHMQ